MDVMYNMMTIVNTATLYTGKLLFFFFFLNLFIDWLIAMLGLRFCAKAFSSCGKRGPLFITVRGPLTIAASLVVEHRLQMRRLSSCGSRAQLLHGMWDLPRPVLEPVSPALAGRFSTTAPPGKPRKVFKTINPKCSHHKEKFFFPLFSLFYLLYLYEKLDVSWTYCGNHFTV